MTPKWAVCFYFPTNPTVSGEVHRASHISKMVLSTVKLGPGNGGSNHAGFVSNRRCQLASSPTAHVYLIFLCRLNNRYPGPGGHQGDARGRLSRLLDWQQDALRLQHSTDTIDTENSGTRGRSIWVHSSQVGKADSQMGVSRRSAKPLALRRRHAASQTKVARLACGRVCSGQGSCNEPIEVCVSSRCSRSRLGAGLRARAAVVRLR